MASQTLGKTYDFNVIYNHANSYLAEGEDNVISLKFTHFLVKKMNTFGLKSGYYHDRDALPGKNIFSELFRVVNGSKWTIVIVSKGFSKNCWSKYSCQSAFKKLIDKDNGENLIPIGLGIKEEEFPDMHGIAQKAWFGLNEEQWKSARADAEWEKLRRLVCPLDVRHHAQESQGLNWTDKRQLVTHDSAVLQEEEEVYYKKVLRQCLAELVRYLEPTSTIDEMVSRGLLLDTQYNDIKNYAEISRKNRTIVEVMQTKDEAGYRNFKTVLQVTKQDYCLRTIEAKERECRETAATKVPGASALVHEKGLPPNDSDEVDAKISVVQMVKPMDESNPIDYGGPKRAAPLTAPKTVSTQNDSSIKAGFQDHDFTDISPFPDDMPVSQQSQGTTGPRLSEPKLVVTKPLNTNLKKASSNIPYTEERSNQTTLGHNQQIQTKPVVVGSSNLANLSKSEPSLPRTTDGDDPPGSRSAEIITEISDQLSSTMSLEPDCGLTMLEVTTQALPIADDARLEQVNTVIVPTIVESAEKSATRTNDIDLENYKAMQKEADSGFSETIVKQVYANKHSTVPIDDTANDVDSLTEEEQTGSLSDDLDKSEESVENLNNFKEMGLFEMRSDVTAFETSPEEPNNQFTNDNPGETATEKASDVAAGGDCTVLGQQLSLSQKAGDKPQACKVSGSPNLPREEPDGQEIHTTPNIHTFALTPSKFSDINSSETIVKKSTKSSQPTGPIAPRPLAKMGLLLLRWYHQAECAYSSIPTLD